VTQCFVLTINVVKYTMVAAQVLNIVVLVVFLGRVLMLIVQFQVVQRSVVLHFLVVLRTNAVHRLASAVLVWLIVALALAVKMDHVNVSMTTRLVLTVCVNLQDIVVILHIVVQVVRVKLETLAAQLRLIVELVVCLGHVSVELVPRVVPCVQLDIHVVIQQNVVQLMAIAAHKMLIVQSHLAV